MRLIFLIFFSLLSAISFAEESNCNYKSIVTVKNTSIELFRLEQTDKAHDYQGGNPEPTTIVSGLYQFVKVNNLDSKTSSWYVFRCANSQNKYDKTQCKRTSIVPIQSSNSKGFFKTNSPDKTTNATPYAKIDKEITFELRNSYNEPDLFYVAANETEVKVTHNQKIVNICKKEENLSKLRPKSNSTGGSSNNDGIGR